MKYFLSILVGIFFVGCTLNKPYATDKSNTITLNIDNEVINLNTDNKHYRESGGPLSNAIFFNNKSLLLEYIKLKPRFTWTGLADGLYQDFLRKNIKELKKTKTYKIKNGDIYKFVTNKQHFYLISLYSGDSNLFLLDYTGKITSKILKTDFSIDRKEQLKIKLEKRFLENYQFKGYFEKQTSDDSTIIPQS